MAALATLVAPAGLGVRDAVFAWAVKGAVPGRSFAVGSLIAIAVRGVQTVVEFLYVAVVTALGRRQGWSIHTGVLHASAEEEAAGERGETGGAGALAPCARAEGSLVGRCAGSAGAALAALLALQALPALLRPPAPPPLAADVGLPRVAGPAAAPGFVVPDRPRPELARVWPARAVRRPPAADRNALPAQPAAAGAAAAHRGAAGARRSPGPKRRRRPPPRPPTAPRSSPRVENRQ